MNAFNFVTGFDYTGSNAELKGKGDYNAFATFAQIRQAGYKLKKGAKGKRIFVGVYKNNDKKEKTRFPKHISIFDIADTNALEDRQLLSKIQEKSSPKAELLN